MTHRFPVGDAVLLGSFKTTLYRNVHDGIRRIRK